MNFCSIKVLIKTPPHILCAALVLFAIMSCASTSEEIDPDLKESIRWYTGETGLVNDDRARLLLESAVSDNDPLSVMWLARVYSTGRMTFTANKELAINLATTVIEQVEALAESGNSEAMFLMGTVYAEGLARTQEPITAILWYRRAAEKNHVLAQHNIGNAYSSGTGLEQSDELAAHWWRLAALQGDAIPQFRLAQLYEQGQGVPQDMTQAVHWYTESAQRGNQNARQALTRLESPTPSAP